MERFLFWQRWLFVVSLLITLFGVVMALLNGTGLFDLFNRQIDPVFWGTQDIADEAKNFQRWGCTAHGERRLQDGVWWWDLLPIPHSGRERGGHGSVSWQVWQYGTYWIVPSQCTSRCTSMLSSIQGCWSWRHFRLSSQESHFLTAVNDKLHRRPVLNLCRSIANQELIWRI